MRIAVATMLGLAGLTAVAPPVRAQDPSLDELLRRAGTYARQLHGQLSGIVAEETYLQEIHTPVDSSLRRQLPNRRALKSDLLLVRPPQENRYVEYRDVFEVDGTAVRERHERLTALFLAPGAASRRQLGAIIAESARHNIGDIPRTINTPMLTLSFLLPDMQQRFAFRALRRAEPALGNRRRRDDNPALFRTSTEMWTLAFRETARPTTIRTNNRRDFPAAGRVWIDPQTGAVLMSELQMDSPEVSATINVSYQSDPVLGFLVPAEMREQYRAGSVTIEGRASYGRFRQFQVTTRETIGRPPGR